MKIGELPVPAKLVQAYADRGITELYPPQEECVQAGLFSGENLLISIPTASGKTLIAEMAMHSHIANGGKCLYVVPLKALASEKYEDFSDKGVKVGIATGDLDRRDNYLGRNDLIIATSEKVDSLLRNRAGWLASIACLVVDEAHLIDSENRGATLEMVIAKLRFKNPGMQIIALTATIGNPKSFAGWLDAKQVTSEWRPVDLREGIYHHGTIYFEDGEKVIETPTKFDDTNLCLDTIKEGGQCLVFVSSRRNAEGFAKRAASALKLEEPELAEYSRRLEAAADTDMGRTLAMCVANGAAFHHAGMKRKQREIVETAFRSGHIKIISSTPTLAAGLNLPARRVIIRDYLRFKGGEGMVPIPVREYRQMAGRAGRPHLDPYGEAVLIAKQKGAVNGLYEEYVDAMAEDVSSKCNEESTLTAHILSLIATEFVQSRPDLILFMEKTFYVYQNKKSRYLKKIVGKALDFLEETEMITINGEQFSATEYGQLISRLYINPHSAETITSALSEVEDFSDKGLLQLLCTTQDMFTLYVKKADLPVIESFYCDHEDEFWTEPEYDEMEEFYRSVKTSMLLNDWIEEVGDDKICDRYGVGPGDIYSAVDGINWLLHAATRLSAMIAPDLEEQVQETEIRMKHGIKRELLPIVRLRGIGRVRARRLFNNNITSIEKLREAGKDRVTAIIGRKITDQIFAQIGEDSEGQADEEIEQTHQASLFNF